MISVQVSNHQVITFSDTNLALCLLKTQIKIFHLPFINLIWKEWFSVGQKSVHAVPLDTLQASCSRFAQHELTVICTVICLILTGCQQLLEQPVFGKTCYRWGPLTSLICHPTEPWFRSFVVARRVLLKIARILKVGGELNLRPCRC
jgi:hypothetical protein